MSYIKIVFIILKLFEVIVFFVYGKLMSKAKNNLTYWKLAFVPMVSYTLIEGLRFGRKIDWNSYFPRYQNLGINTDLEDYEPVFEFICHSLYNLGISYPIFILLQCSLVIFAVVLFLSNHKEYIKWALPISLIMISGNEMFIRFFMGFAFGIIGIYFSDKENLNSKIKYFYAIFFAILGGLNHLGAYIFLLLIIFKRYINKFVIPWQISVLLLFLTTFIMKPTDLLFITKFTDFLYVLGGNEFHGAGYLGRTEELLSGEFGLVGYMNRSLQTGIRTFGYSVPIYIYGSKYLNKDKDECFYYNIFVIGSIVDPLFGTIEIFNRFSTCLLFMATITCSSVYMQFERKLIQSKMQYILIYISMVFLFYVLITDIFFRNGDINMMFLWDAMGRDYLKYNI